MRVKNRTTPYGYMYDNGVIVINSSEVQSLMRIFELYLNGKSLLQIADQLNAELVEYLPGVTGWNKSRLMRIIEDERYIGTDIYPSIIDENTHRTLIAIKAEKSSQKHIDRSAGFFKIKCPIVCSNCGAEMRRQTDTRRKCPQRWICKNNDCNVAVPIADEKLLAEITELLNSLIVNPDMITIVECQIQSDTDTQQLRNDIERELNNCHIDHDSLRQKIMDLASLKYRDIDNTVRISKQLRTDFTKSNPILTCSAELLNRTVEQIQITADGKIGLVLINGQLVRKG